VRLRWLENGHRVLAMQAVVRDVCGLIALGSRQASAGSNGLAEGRGTEVADGLLSWAMGKGGVALVQVRGSSARVLW
jgi:hypothetical protein